jgi:hypothetical protein
MDPVTDPGSAAQKPAWKSLAAWTAVAIAVSGALMETGIIGDGTTAAKIIGAVVAVITALGLVGARTALQMNGNKTSSAVEVAKVAASIVPK